MPIIAHQFTEDLKKPALVLVHGLGLSRNHLEKV
jgi:hypothetical protein